MESGNVLVLGNSGSGKSTLINAVIGENAALTGWGITGTTKALEIYEGKDIPFRLIDSVGFEPSFFKRKKAIHEVEKWSKKSAKKGLEDTSINVIWFCVEGTSSKLFPQTIESLVKATRIYKSVPIIVVITKSYSTIERTQNIEMVKQAFAKNKKALKNLKDILPVVAAPYSLSEDVIVAPEGLEELIELTNSLMPSGIKAGKGDIDAYKLKRKRILSQATIITAASTGAVVGAIPIPFADGLILQPTELAEVKAIASIYGIKKSEKSQKLIMTMIELGTVGALAKTVISGLKAIPGINLATQAINAAVAATIITTLGESSAYIFEQIDQGHHGLEDMEWVKQVFESKMTVKMINKVNDALAKLPENAKPEEILKSILSALKK